MFIREHNGHKYRIYNSEDFRTIIAVSSFAGKTVKGVAKCAPEDTPDLETGIELAILRCDVKIALKKLDRVDNKINKFFKESVIAKKKYDDAFKYRIDIRDSLARARDALIEFENKIEKKN